jgi:predicted NAD/FAD-binding protein
MSTATAAELSAAAEAINGYQQRVSGLAAAYAGTDRDDLVAAIYEAERSLGVAERTIRRALKLVST